MTTKRMMKRTDIKQLIEKVKVLSPFELKDELIKIAERSRLLTNRQVLNAGRGNPNWDGGYTASSLFHVRSVCS